MDSSKRAAKHPYQLSLPFAQGARQPRIPTFLCLQRNINVVAWGVAMGNQAYLPTISTICAAPIQTQWSRAPKWGYQRMSTGSASPLQTQNFHTPTQRHGHPG